MLPDFSPTQLLTIRNTVASDTNPLEFDLFMNAARSYGLDPFRKQISAIVFNKDKQDKRKMAIIVGRDGLRSIAARCGDYRPADTPATITYDADLKGPTNPLGIVTVGVTLYKQDNRGAWNKVYGEADWAEFAPLTEVWAYDNDAGKKMPTGTFYPLTGNWAKMPKVMITKCAEAQALRAGWPDQIGGIYAEEEMQAQVMKDVTPSQEIDNELAFRRESAIGGRGVLLSMDESGALQRIPVGQVADRCLELIHKSDPETVFKWNAVNREGLKEFWSHAPNDALEVKKAIELKTINMKMDAA